MKYKKMAVYMTDTEIQTLMQLVYENVELTHYKRYENENFIRVYFKHPCSSNDKEMQIDFLPDDIYINDELQFTGNENQIFLYHQYMIANGYSDYWKGNMFSSQYSNGYSIENIIRVIEDNQTRKILETLSNCPNLVNAIDALKLYLEK